MAAVSRQVNTAASADVSFKNLIFHGSFGSVVTVANSEILFTVENYSHQQKQHILALQLLQVTFKTGLNWLEASYSYGFDVSVAILLGAQI